jgi:hypothetical protein
VGVRPQGDAKGTSETKVGKLEVALLVDEEVLGLKVAVEHAVSMAVVEALDELVAEFLRGSVMSEVDVGRDMRVNWTRGRRTKHPDPILGWSNFMSTTGGSWAARLSHLHPRPCPTNLLAPNRRNIESSTCTACEPAFRTTNMSLMHIP